jgi:hypothetical protein
MSLLTLDAAIFITKTTAVATTACACGHADRQPTIVRVPMYSDYCDCCQDISAAFDYWAACTSCNDRVCPSCSATPHEAEDERGAKTLCHRCAADPQN